MLQGVVTTLSGDKQDLAAYQGKALLIVNTASECGHTPQYFSLQKLYENYQDKGLVVLGFPSNDFGNQEPGTEKEIQEFCQLNFGVTFPLFAKVKAKGPDKAPVFKWLTEEGPENLRGEIRWNFTKFLVDPQGRIVKRWDSKIDPFSPEVQQAVKEVLPAS